jgi:hypothetical protein
MPSGASLKGAAEMRERLKGLRGRFPGDVARALYQETQVEATEVKKRTPVDKGPLRASEHVVGPMRQGNRIWTLIVCGGTAAPYAVYVHENLEALHKVGQAKFLESVILESRPYIAARVAKRVRLNAISKSKILTFLEK